MILQMCSISEEHRCWSQKSHFVTQRNTHFVFVLVFVCRGRVEFPRDPLGEPGPDENMPQGGFRRLMAATTFESPFAKKKRGFSPLGLDEVGERLLWPRFWRSQRGVDRGVSCVVLLDVLFLLLPVGCFVLRCGDRDTVILGLCTWVLCVVVYLGPVSV